MKQIILLSLAAMLMLPACGASDEEPQQEDETNQEAAEDQARSDYETWLFSDERPVNMACMGPGYRRGQAETNVALHSPLYPSIQVKQERLLQELRDLTPTVTDPDMHDAVAYNAMKDKLSILNQFVFMMGVDSTPRSPMLMCDRDQYESGKYQMMANMMGDDFKVENVAVDGDALSFTTGQVKERLNTNVSVTNRDLDSVTIATTANSATQFNGKWIRDVNGAERFDATAGPGVSFHYTENPDCSGEARWQRHHDDDDKRWITSIQWSSVKDDNFSLSFRDCYENDLGEMDCKAGGL